MPNASFPLSDEEKKKFIDFMTKNFPDLVSDSDKYRYALRAIQTTAVKNPVVNPDAVQELQCVNRIMHGGFSWCVNRPPKMVKLETLEICRVCKQRRLGLTEKTLSPSQPQAQPSPQPNNDFPLYRGNTPIKPATTFCPAGGLWVPLSKCDLCKSSAFNVYDRCQKQKNPNARIPQPPKGETTCQPK
jgi:hypothetical protein